MPKYRDFELFVGPGTGRSYPLRVTASPVGFAEGTLEFPFDGPTLDTILASLSDEIDRARSAGGPPPAEGEPAMRGVKMAESHAASTATVTQFGTALFQALFNGAVGEAFRRSKREVRAEKARLRVRLRVEAPELAALPWEFLYDPAVGDFVVLGADTPLVRYLQMPEERPREALAVAAPLRVLAMIADATDHRRLDVAKERQRVEEALAGLTSAGLLEIDWLETATVDALQNALRKGVYHVFHFIGHGGFDETLGKGVLVFTDEHGRGDVMDAAMVARILAPEDTLRLVVLNACLGAKGSRSDLFSSTAATLVRGGVPAVIGMQYEISDRAAIEFARTLYDAIGDGFPIDAAVAEARVRLSTTRGSVEWGTPVLHMHAADGVLFEISGMTTSEARRTGAYRVQGGPAGTPAPAAAASTSTPPAVTQGAAPVPLPAAPPPAPPVQPPSAAAPPPSASPASGGLGKGVAIGAAVAVAAIVALVMALGSGNDGTAAPADSVEASGAAADSADGAPSWAVGFESVQGPEHVWYRVESSCRWFEPVIQGADTTFNEYVQVAGDVGTTELFDRARNITLHLPNLGGWVSVDSGGGRELANYGVRVTTQLAAAPTPLPECEQPVR